MLKDGLANIQKTCMNMQSVFQGTVLVSMLKETLLKRLDLETYVHFEAFYNVKKWMASIP